MICIGVVKNCNLCTLARHIFGTFRVKAEIMMQRHEVPRGLSNDPKICDLKWPRDTILC